MTLAIIIMGTHFGPPSPCPLMNPRARILVVAATARELAAADGWRTLCCGVGPVEAAAATAAAIATDRPSMILHVGIAGARPESGLEPPSIVIGQSARYTDLGVPEKWAPRTVDASDMLIAAARRALPDASVCVIGTSAYVGGTVNADDDVICDVEAMEGFAVLRAAQLAGIPAIEVRAISNFIDEADRMQWKFAEAFAAIAAVTPRLVAEFVTCVR